VILLVMLYAVVVFVQLTIAGQVEVDALHCYTGNTTHPDYIKDCEPSVSGTQNFLNTLDLAFLSVFVFEICFRLLGYGIAFLRDGVQLLDTVVVVLAFITALVPSSAIASGGNFLNLLRIIRLLRLALIFSRLQRSRDAAAMRSKRAMYRRLGAPVERVLTFLTEFKGRQRAKRDQDNIDWMMEVIASDELYSVAEFDEETLSAMQGAAGGAGPNDMSRYLTETTGLARRRPGSEEEDAEDEAAGVKSSAGTSSTTKMRKLSTSDDSNWATAAIASPAIAPKLARMLGAEAWSFDIFELDLACGALPAPATGKTATIVCYYLLEHHGVLEAMEIDRPKMLGWLSAVEDAYLAANPYHNALHAADACVTVNYFLKQPGLARIVQPIDVLSTLIAALVHDLAHPGLNNTYLEATKDALAITYNDVSVLENHHVATAFKLLQPQELDWTKSMKPDDYKDFRETLVTLVLGTDMRAHFEHLTKFKSKLAGEGFTNISESPNARKDMRLLLTVALHAADISNPAKPQAIATAWARRSMDEFFRQGDREVELSLPVSPFMDRTKVPLATTVVNCQIGFINVLVRPLLSEWAVFLGPDADRDIIITLEATLRLWETSGAKIIDSWGEFAARPKAASVAEPSDSKSASPTPGRAGGKASEEKSKPKGKAAVEAGTLSNRNVKQTV